MKFIISRRAGEGRYPCMRSFRLQKSLYSLSTTPETLCPGRRCF